jgi:hypothetical protein
MIATSFVKRFKIRPTRKTELHFKERDIDYYFRVSQTSITERLKRSIDLPTGFVSKKSIGARIRRRNILIKTIN